MTFEDLARELPNGFHDAEIFRISLDYGGRTAALEMAFWTGDIEGSNPEEFRRGTLFIRGLLYLSIEPPDPDYPFMQADPSLSVAGCPEDPKQFPDMEKLVSASDSKVDCYRFYVRDWNSFIHLAATDVQLSWSEAQSVGNCLDT